VRRGWGSALLKYMDEFVQPLRRVAR